MTGYFPTSPRYQVNKIPGEAIKMEAGGRTPGSESTRAPPCLEPLFRAKLLMKAHYCTFPEGNTESFMK